MKKSSCLLLLLLCLGWSAHSAFATSRLESEKIKSLYKDGEFEKVKEVLENFLKKSDASASREDRILAYKYLGVVYARKPGGKPQAEAYFFRLFDLAPKANIAELYVSSSVNEVFKNTRERFLSEQQASNAVDEFGNPVVGNPALQTDGDAMAMAAKKWVSPDTLLQTKGAKEKAPIKNEPRNRQSLDKKGPVIWPWILGAAVVGGGIGLYVLTSQEQDPEVETISAGSK